MLDADSPGVIYDHVAKDLSPDRPRGARLFAAATVLDMHSVVATPPAIRRRVREAVQDVIERDGESSLEASAVLAAASLKWPETF